MAFSNRKKEKLFTEINITPLTDIFLVLLIIMMVVAPSFKTMDNTVEVPEVKNGLSVDVEKTTIFHLFFNSLNSINGRLCQEMNALPLETFCLRQ